MSPWRIPTEIDYVALAVNVFVAVVLVGGVATYAAGGGAPSATIAENPGSSARSMPVMDDVDKRAPSTMDADADERDDGERESDVDDLDDKDEDDDRRDRRDEDRRGHGWGRGGDKDHDEYEEDDAEEEAEEDTLLAVLPEPLIDVVADI